PRRRRQHRLPPRRRGRQPGDGGGGRLPLPGGDGRPGEDRVRRVAVGAPARRSDAGAGLSRLLLDPLTGPHRTAPSSPNGASPRRGRTGRLSWCKRGPAPPTGGTALAATPARGGRARGGR